MSEQRKLHNIPLIFCVKVILEEFIAHQLANGCSDTVKRVTVKRMTVKSKRTAGSNTVGSNVAGSNTANSFAVTSSTVGSRTSGRHELMAFGDCLLSLFDHCLGLFLLLRFERQQYADYRKTASIKPTFIDHGTKELESKDVASCLMPPSQVYGYVHLLRLMVKLSYDFLALEEDNSTSDMLLHWDNPDNRVKFIGLCNDLVGYLVEKRNRYHSVINYVYATPQYCALSKASC